MKKILAILCAASALLACNKINDNKTPEEGNLDQKIVSFNFSVKQDGGDTKAKTGFESGDKVLVFFEGVAEKYVTLSYDGSTWTASASAQLYTDDFDGKTKLLNAIYFPSFVGEVTVAYSAGAFSFTDGAGDNIYTYYMYANDVGYKVSGGKITATITMSKPAGFVQFFVPGTSASHGYRLLESHLQPKACTSVSLDGSINVDESIASGYVVKGYPASNNSTEGTMFSCYVTSTGESTSYSFSLVTYISEEIPAAMGTQTLSGTKTISDGVIFNLPNLSGTWWSTITPFVDLGYAGGPLWATGNLKETSPFIADPLEAGDYYKWGYSTPYDVEGTTDAWGDYKDDAGFVDTATAKNSYWCMPTKAQFNALINSWNTTRVWNKGWTSLGSVNGGYLITSKVNGISLFFAAAGYYNNGSFIGAGEFGDYWSSTPFGSNYAYRLYFDGAIVSPGDNFRRYRGFSVRPVQN